MVPLEMTPATVVLGLIIVTLAALALRRLFKKGLCDCHADKDGTNASAGCGCAGGCAGCRGCSSINHKA